MPGSLTGFGPRSVALNDAWHVPGMPGIFCYHVSIVTGDATYVHSSHRPSPRRESIFRNPVVFALLVVSAISGTRRDCSSDADG
jgi:hypothetical protein